jgi:hypothetical protein
MRLCRCCREDGREGGGESRWKETDEGREGYGESWFECDWERECCECAASEEAEEDGDDEGEDIGESSTVCGCGTRWMRCRSTVMNSARAPLCRKIRIENEVGRR